ncbi:MAG: response regulator transcription factor [Syntrophomonadaceae bacterium]
MSREVAVLANRILIIEDEVKILQAVADFLTGEGFQVTALDDARQAAGMALSGRYDLVVLDLMMPYLNGLEVCRQIRQTSNIPVIMLTARSDEVDKLLGLELGADDYITKPYSPRELAARIRAVLRRTGQQPPARDEVLKVGPVSIDVVRFEAWIDDTALTLTPSEFKILQLLMEHPGQVFSRLQLLENVYGDAYEGYERTIDTHISNLRRKLDRDPDGPSLIRSVYGVGYKFSERGRENEEV